jgi:hypothetical protein
VRQKAYSYEEYLFLTKQTIEAEERGELIQSFVLLRINILHKNKPFDAQKGRQLDPPLTRIVMVDPAVFPFVRQKAYSYEEYLFLTKQTIEAEERGHDMVCQAMSREIQLFLAHQIK